MKLQTLQAYRGLAALWVLLYHINAISIARLGKPWGDELFREGLLGVDFFFVLSGFIIYHIHARDLGQPEKAPRYLLKRFFRIYPLLFVVLSVKLFYALVLGAGGVPEHKLNAEVIFSSFLLLPVSDTHGGLPLIDVAWTLSHEFLFYGLFGMGILLGRRFLLGLFTAWGLLVFSIGGFWPGQAGLLIQFLFNPHNLQFMAGLAVGIVAERNFLSSRSGLCLLAFGLVGLVVGLAAFPAFVQQSALVKRLCWGAVFSLIVAGSVEIERARPVAVPRWLTLLGDASYSVYLVHSSIQVLLVLTCHAIATDLGLTHFSFLSLVAILSLLGAIGVHFAIEKPLQAITSRFLGGRRPDPTATPARSEPLDGSPHPIARASAQ